MKNKYKSSSYSVNSACCPALGPQESKQDHEARAWALNLAKISKKNKKKTDTGQRASIWTRPGSNNLNPQPRYSFNKHEL